MSTSTLIVTGANGFLGRHVVMGALARGYAVRALARQAQWLLALQHPLLSVVEWDLAQGPPPSETLHDAVALLHLAAHIPPDFADSAHAEACLQLNALGTLRLLNASVAADVGRFVYFAAGNAYAPSTQARCEDDALFPAHRAPYYLTSKIAGEIYAEHFRLSGKLPATSLRVSSPYGPGMNENSLVARGLARLRRGEVWEIADGGRYTMDMVWVGDVVDAALNVVERGVGGVFNVASGEHVSSGQVALTLAEVLGAPPDLVRVLPENSQATPGFAPLNIAKARRELGFVPKSLRAGLQLYCETG